MTLATLRKQKQYERLLSPRFLNLATCLGAFVCAAGMLTARAIHLLFQRGYGYHIANSTFSWYGHTSVHGTFNSGRWSHLHQQGSGTVLRIVDDTGDATAGWRYKFVDSNSGRQWRVRNSGVRLHRWAKLPPTARPDALHALFHDAGPLVTNEVTFQVDVSQQISWHFIPERVISWLEDYSTAGRDSVT